MQEFSVVITTCAGTDEANTIIDALLKARLAACIQAMPIQSHYIWEGDIQQSSELMLVIKCKSEDYKGIEETILRLHSYDLPEIVRIPIVEGLDRYLAWLKDPK